MFVKQSRRRGAGDDLVERAEASKDTSIWHVVQAVHRHVEAGFDAVRHGIRILNRTSHLILRRQQAFHPGCEGIRLVASRAGWECRRFCGPPCQRCHEGRFHGLNGVLRLGAIANGLQISGFTERTAVLTRHIRRRGKVEPQTSPLSRRKFIFGHCRDAIGGLRCRQHSHQDRCAGDLGKRGQHRVGQALQVARDASSMHGQLEIARVYARV